MTRPRVFFLLENYSEEQFINIGYGSDVTISNWPRPCNASLASAVNSSGTPASRTGTPRKLMDSSRLFALGWKPKVNLETGIQLAYEFFLKSGTTR